MKTLLTIDTSADYCSIALSFKNTLICRRERGFKSHANVILSFVDELLNEAGMVLSNVDSIIFTQGPGSFTGLRISACVAQGLAVSQDIGVIGISTLQALAQGAHRILNKNNIWVVNDARMNEVYHGRYQLNAKGFMSVLGEEKVEPLSKIEWQLDEWTYIGSGLMLDDLSLPNSLLMNESSADFNSVSPVDLITLAQFHTPKPAELALPTYIRNNVAHKKRGTHG